MSTRLAMFFLVLISLVSLGQPAHQIPPPALQVNGPSNDQNYAERLKIARFYFVQGNYKAAKARYSEVLADIPDNPEALFGVAESHEKLGETRKAKDGFEAYLKTAPNGVHSEQARQKLRELEGTK